MRIVGLVQLGIWLDHQSHGSVSKQPEGSSKWGRRRKGSQPITGPISRCTLHLEFSQTGSLSHSEHCKGQIHQAHQATKTHRNTLTADSQWATRWITGRRYVTLSLGVQYHSCHNRHGLNHQFSLMSKQSMSLSLPWPYTLPGYCNIFGPY